MTVARVPWLCKPVPPVKRERITPLATQSQWCRLSVLILISIAWPTNSLANLHHYAQFPAGIHSSIFWRTGVSFLPPSTQKAIYPLLQTFTPLIVFFFFIANICFLLSSQGDHKIYLVAFFKTSLYLPTNVLKWSGAHCLIIKQILETLVSFLHF